MSKPLLSTARRREAVMPVNHTLEVAVNCEVVAVVKFCRALHQLALPRLSEIVPLVVMVPPERPAPAAMEVTVPAFCVRQLPAIAKQPAARLKPFAAVEDADELVRFKAEALKPLNNVEVAEATKLPTF